MSEVSAAARAIFPGAMWWCAGHALHMGGHAHHHLAPGKIALAAALLSVVAKELLFRATARVGRRLKSPVLEANAWHHRSDALSSVVALLGVAAARLPGGAFASADALAGLAVACMLGWTGARISLGALKELSDAVDHGDLDGLRFRALNVPGVASVASMRGVRSTAVCSGQSSTNARSERTARSSAVIMPVSRSASPPDVPRTSKTSARAFAPSRDQAAWAEA